MSKPSHQFVLAPVVDPAQFAAEIDAALHAYHAYLGAAVASQLDHDKFRAASKAFRQKSDDLAAQLGIAGAHSPEFIKQAWWLNLSAAGFTAAGVDAQKVREQLEELQTSSDLLSRLALQPNPGSRPTAKLNEYVHQQVASVLSMFWWFLSDTALVGSKIVDPFTRVRCAADNAYFAGLKFSALGRDFPLPGVVNGNDSYNAWRFNIYRLVLQLLGYQPTR